MVVPWATDAPDLPHHKLVQEVHNLYTQAAQDAKFFEQTKETIENHADALEALRQFGKRMSGKIDSLAADLTKVANDVVKNDADVKVTLEESDVALKNTIQENDDFLKSKLKTLEAIVTDQVNRICATAPPGAAAAADAGTSDSQAAIMGLQAKIHDGSTSR